MHKPTLPCPTHPHLLLGGSKRHAHRSVHSRGPRQRRVLQQLPHQPLSRPRLLLHRGGRRGRGGGHGRQVAANAQEAFAQQAVAQPHRQRDAGLLQAACMGRQRMERGWRVGGSTGSSTASSRWEQQMGAADGSSTWTDAGQRREQHMG